MGGLSQGFTETKFEELLSVDNDPAAIETHKRNFSSKAKNLTISFDFELPPASIVAGGPPCQGFSSAGLRRSDDLRNSLISCFAKLVARAQPEAFVFENVEGFLTAGDGERVLDLLLPLIEAGYQIHLRKINAANYGVPQHRKRVIAIGGLGWTPRFPEPTHFAYGAPGTHRVSRHLPPCPTVSEALEGLPEADPAPPGLPQGHHTRPLSRADSERIAALRPGQTMRDLPLEFHHKSYKSRANRRVRDGVPTERRGGAPAGIRRLRPDEPSKAITGGARVEFIHPFHDRNVTIRECARLQTFPDDFLFCGTLSQQMQLIGNAVPPKLSRAIAKTLREDLENLPAHRGEGRLISFVPTHSTGVSPSLRETTNKVRAKFGLMPQTGTLPLWD